jgi:hypothetical protein
VINHGSRGVGGDEFPMQELLVALITKEGELPRRETPELFGSESEVVAGECPLFRNAQTEIVYA